MSICRGTAILAVFFTGWKPVPQDSLQLLFSRLHPLRAGDRQRAASAPVPDPTIDELLRSSVQAISAGLRTTG